MLKHSEAVRTMMSDNPQWQPLHTLFQFLMCPVPTTLKAKIVSALAALAISPRLSPTVRVDTHPTHLATVHGYIHTRQKMA